MKNISLIFAGFSLLFIASADAMNWWERPTICQAVPFTEVCPGAGGPGFEMQMWDTTGISPTQGCWGVRRICREAFLIEPTDPRDDYIARPRHSTLTSMQIRSEFTIYSTNEINAFNAERGCYGVRLMAADSTRAVCTPYRTTPVWCPDVAESFPHINWERVGTGYMSCTENPTCRELAERGWVAMRGANCYGREFPYDNGLGYFIECPSDINEQAATRIVRLNTAGVVNQSTGERRPDAGGQPPRRAPQF
ncbi:MAG: hypothetical protein FWC83_02030, partial [Alphaproteobacteria bacterium]|nr:hypothetical protein [Alphaproteobacteria bacterium]